jgi:hypothetical protein
MSILGFRPKQYDAPQRWPKHNVRYALGRNVNHGALVEPIRCVTSKPVVGPEQVEALRLMLVETAKEPPLCGGL